MITPSCGATLTHFQDILDHLEDGGLRVAPDVVEECQGVDVDYGLHRKFSKEEVECWYWRGTAQL